MNIFHNEREAALARAFALFEHSVGTEVSTARPVKRRIDTNAKPQGVRLLIYHAGLRVPRWLILSLSVFLGITLALIFSKILSIYFAPVFFLAGFMAPLSYLDLRATRRASEFATDYPTVMLATASSVKIGLTPYLALERAIRLLPKKSLVRVETEQLLAKLHAGSGKEQAIAEFAASIRQPDLPLFRAAFSLAVDHGGRFAPTLHRLAHVCRDRQMLVSGALVSTANMRMTANILLAVAPVIVSVIALRTEGYWDLFFNHPVANLLASTGIVVIILSYTVLRRMSNFKP